MKIRCVWEHNGDDSLLHAVNFIGAFTRGSSLNVAIRKMPCEIQAYLKWKGDPAPGALEVEIIQQSDYFGEIRVAVDNEGSILECREHIWR